MYSEDQLIKRVSAAFSFPEQSKSRPTATPRVRLGIGDDAAIVSQNGKIDQVFTCDAFMEGIHFIPDSYPPESVGYKSLVRATSDLAAMGATPRFFLLTLALPAERTGVWLTGFLQGMRRASRYLGIHLIGGDTTRFPRIAISITCIGEVPSGQGVTRSGARPGDIIYVSGTLGKAQLGLELMRRGLGNKVHYRQFLRTHLYPRIQVELGGWLARHGLATAMMDISDGLSTDLSRLCTASNVGARLTESRIPRVEVPPRLSTQRPKLSPLQMALHGGEDYELLFTVSPKSRARLRRAPGFRDLVEIGEITREKRFLLIAPNGEARGLEPEGWDPFSQ